MQVMRIKCYIVTKNTIINEINELIKKKKISNKITQCSKGTQKTLLDNWEHKQNMYACKCMCVGFN